MFDDPLLHRAMQAAHAARRIRDDYTRARRAALSTRIVAIGRVVALMETVTIARRLCARRDAD